MNTTLLWQMAFWFSGGCLCRTYLGYPVFIKWLAQGRINNPLKNNNTKPCNSENTDLEFRHKARELLILYEKRLGVKDLVDGLDDGVWG